MCSAEFIPLMILRAQTVPEISIDSTADVSLTAFMERCKRSLQSESRAARGRFEIDQR